MRRLRITLVALALAAAATVGAAVTTGPTANAKSHQADFVWNKAPHTVVLADFVWNDIAKP